MNRVNATSKDRHNRAYILLSRYGFKYGHRSREDFETALTDLMADLYHVIDKHAAPFDDIRRVAYRHFVAEQTGKG